MNRRTVALRLIVLASVVAMFAVSTPARGQDFGPKPEEQSLGQLLFNIRHHILMGEFEIATRYANLVLSQKPEPLALISTIETDPQNVLNRREDGMYAVLERAALRTDLPQLSKAASELQVYIRESIVKLKKDPATINRALEMLADGPRQYDLGVERLQWTAPWSVPMMISALMDENRVKLHKHITVALPEMGRPAVEPLCEALDMSGNAATKMVIISTLAKIGYPHAIPYLRRQVEQDGSEQIRAACMDAIRVLTRSAQRGVYTGQASEMFYQLAENYYTDQPSLRLDAVAAAVPVWRWQMAKGGVTSLEVPAAVYKEVMAVRSLVRSLELNAEQPDSVALWLCSLLRMQAKLNGAPNPLGMADANYYAVLVGSRVLLRSLARSIQDNDAAVAYGVVKALNDVGVDRAGTEAAGALQLALAFPDRRVRYETAQAYRPIGHDRLVGTDIACRVLAEALGQAGQTHALALLPRPDDSKAILEQLAAAGYPAERVTVVATRQAAIDAVRAADAPLLDLVVLAYDSPEGGLLGLTQLREDFRFRGVPTLLMTNAAEAAIEATRNLTMVQIVSPDVPAPEITQKVSAMLAAAGSVPLNEEDAHSYALRSAEVLRLLALNPATIDDVQIALPTLIKTLVDARQDVAIAAGQALAAIAPAEAANRPNAQRSIAQAALDAKADAAKRVALFAALADSLKRFGNKLTADQFESLLAVATRDENEQVRVAAARAAGAAGATMQIEMLILQ